MNDPSSEYLTTRELAALLRIKERKVYDLASSGAVPCTRATGKLLFPRRGIERWLAASGEGPGSAPRKAARPNVMLGSHDPLLEWALQASGSGIAGYFDGSQNGLARFTRDEGIATALHVYCAAERSWNRAAAARCGGASTAVLVEFCWRSRGILFRGERGATMRGIGDLKGRRVIRRQPGSGSQTLLEHLLSEHALDAAHLEFTDMTHTETESAVAILNGTADAALGLESLAAQYDLGFTPLIRERFDLLVNRHAWFDPPFQRFIRFCTSQALQKRAATLRGYDATGVGTVHFNGR